MINEVIVCRRCAWYAPVLKGSKEIIDVHPSGVGECRRHAPTSSGFPVVFEDGWCGDHIIRAPDTPAAAGKALVDAVKANAPEIKGAFSAPVFGMASPICLKTR